jgi:hypothetical protein
MMLISSCLRIQKTHCCHSNLTKTRRYWECFLGFPSEDTAKSYSNMARFYVLNKRVKLDVWLISLGIEPLKQDSIFRVHNKDKEVGLKKVSARSKSLAPLEMRIEKRLNKWIPGYKDNLSSASPADIRRVSIRVIAEELLDNDLSLSLVCEKPNPLYAKAYKKPNSNSRLYLMHYDLYLQVKRLYSANDISTYLIYSKGSNSESRGPASSSLA